MFTFIIINIIINCVLKKKSTIDIFFKYKSAFLYKFKRK